MTNYSSLFAGPGVLLSRKWFKVAGTYTHAVPASATHMRASIVGCGGMGDQSGGGGAFARSKVPVTPGETIWSQVGNTATQSASGDSAVRRTNSSGAIIAYADRGRGNGSHGQAANSVGDVKRSGSGVGFGKAGSDEGDFGALGFQGNPVTVVYGNSDPGCGGRLAPIWDSNGTYLGHSAVPAGMGLVCLEFFNGDPGY